MNDNQQAFGPETSGDGTAPTPISTPAPLPPTPVSLPTPAPTPPSAPPSSIPGRPPPPLSESPSWVEQVKSVIGILLLLCVIGLSGWVSVEVIARVPLLQEGLQARGSTYTPEALRKEIEITRTNLALPDQDASPFSRLHPLQPLVNTLATYGVSVSISADSTLPSWLFGYSNSPPATPLTLDAKVKGRLNRLGEELTLPMSARADLYRTLQRARADAEFVKTALVERTVQDYRADVSPNGAADTARTLFNRHVILYYNRARAVNAYYSQCAAGMVFYDGTLIRTANEILRYLPTIPGDLKIDFSVSPDVYISCTRGKMESGSMEGIGLPVVAKDPASRWDNGLIGVLVGGRLDRLDFVLIIGMLGLGVLGASASQLIRADEGNRVNALVSANMVGIMVRGITATLVVYLGVSCGLVVFSNGGAQANPYALLLGCFIASVFSENVWAWARKLIGERLGAVT